MAVAVAAEVAVGVVAAGREPGVVLAPEAFGVPGAPVGAGLVGGGVAAARGPCGTGGAAVLCAPGADAFVDALLGAGTFVAALPFADGVPVLQGGQGTATGNVIAVGAAPQRFPGRRPTARRGVHDGIRCARTPPVHGAPVPVAQRGAVAAPDDVAIITSIAAGFVASVHGYRE